MPMRPKRCGTCAAWRRYEIQTSLGSCRRHAPGTGGHPQRFAVWPETSKDDWCLEHVEEEGADGQRMA